MRKLMPPVDHPRTKDWVYDLECFPNYFLAKFKHSASGRRYSFEISEWVHQGRELFQFLTWLAHHKQFMVGFNNEFYDYPMLHEVYQVKGLVTYDQMYRLNCAIIGADNRYEYNIWHNKRFCVQIDLRGVHHFDNHAKMTSLKVIEINNRAKNVRDLPYKPGTVLTYGQSRNMSGYCDHDIDETEQFYYESMKAIQFRAELTEKHGKDFFSYNDTKIGSEIFTMELEKRGMPTKVNGVKRQTFYDTIAVKDLIFDYIWFETPEFNAILDRFEGVVINPEKTKGALDLVDDDSIKGNEFTIKGFKYVIGLGGIHASIHNSTVRSSHTHTLIDIDVASFYPNLAIANKYYPTQYGEGFCDIYLEVYNLRKSFPKKTAENGMLKLALNSVYGNSNSKYSVFYDPKYTFTTTINGQLLLLMLAEQLMKIPDLTMVQVNTDGLTFLCPNEYLDHQTNLCKWWEDKTNLELERVDYKSMFIRDVNSYIAVTTDDYVKRIGCYAHVRAAEDDGTREVPWHKDHSALVIPKAAQAALVDGVNIETFLRNHTDIHDFVIKAKVPKNSYLDWGGVPIQGTSRVYASTNGRKLTKVMPPTEKQIEKWETGDHYYHEDHGGHKLVGSGKKPQSGKYKLGCAPSAIPPDRRISIGSGFEMKDCNDIDDFDPEDIDYEYYLAKVRKIVDPVLLGDQV